MSERRGVMLAMFDLPMKNSEQRRLYASFRKQLMQSGYRYFQHSVYIKLLRNISSAGREMQLLNSYAPEDSNVQAIPLSLNTFKGLTALRGEEFDMGLFSDDVVFIGNNDEAYSDEIDDAEMLELFEKHSGTDQSDDEAE